MENERRHWSDEADSTEKLHKKLKELEDEKSTIEKKKYLFAKEKAKLEEEIENLDENIRKAIDDLEKESIGHVKSEQEALGMREEVDFLKQLWEQVHFLKSFLSLGFNRFH